MILLFEMSRNYKNYRETVKACKPPVIPYLGIFLFIILLLNYYCFFNFY